MKKLVKIAAIIFLTIGVILSSRNGYLKCKESHRLVSSRILTSGRIVDFGKPGGKTRDIPARYIFLVEGKQYQGEFNRNKLCYFPKGKDEAELKRANIPIIYDASNPGINRILVKKRDYAKYKVEYPDSIGTILDKYFGCWSLFFGS